MKFDDMTKKITNMGEEQGVFMGLFVIAAIALLMFIQIYHYSTMKSSKCDTIVQNFQKTTLGSFNPNMDYFKHPLHDYYVKSAFNCCAVSDFDNTYVAECALLNVIKNGARLLDFEIYSMKGGKPIIAVSNVDSFYVKQTFNYLDFDYVMNYIKSNAFTSQSGCPNPHDPLILHFRIKSTKPELHDKMAKILSETFPGEDMVLGPDFSNAFTHSGGSGCNLGNIPLNALHKDGKFGNYINSRPRVIIMVDQSNKTYLNTKLYEYVNIESGGRFLQLIHDFDVKNNPNIDLLKEQNQTNMTIVIPDSVPEGGGGLSSLHCCVPGSKNPDFRRNFKLGCQFVCMCFQNNDNYLKNYNNYFDKAGSAFVLKPECLRYKPVTIPKPQPQKVENSFAERNVEAIPGVASFKI